MLLFAWVKRGILQSRVVKGEWWWIMARLICTETLYQNWLHRGKKLWHSIVPLLRKQTVMTSCLGITLPRPHSNFTSWPIANTCSTKNWALLKMANVLSISENFQWQNRTVFSRNISKSGEMYTKFFWDFLPEFPFHLIFVLEFTQFSIEWLHIRFSGNFSKKCPYYLHLFWNFLKFWLNGEHLYNIQGYM